MAIRNTQKTASQMETILSFMKPEEEYQLLEICAWLGLRETRTKAIMRRLIAEGKIEAVGGNRGRRYRLGEPGF